MPCIATACDIRKARVELHNKHAEAAQPSKPCMLRILHLPRHQSAVKARSLVEDRLTCSWQMETVVSEDSMVLTPAATAAVPSPFSRPLCARCAATSEEEQAVSVLTQGPPRPKV